MKIQYFTSSAVAIVLSTFATVTAYANNENNSGSYNNWTPQNQYWQAPNWSNFNFPPTSQQRRPYYGPQGAYQQQPRQAPNYRPRIPNYNQQQNMNRPNPNMAPPQNAYRGNSNMAPPQNAYRGIPPPPNGPYKYGPDNGASAFNVPGYNRNRNNNGWGNNGWNNNKFWGQSGPNQWMNPNKHNMEQGWDDMINAPSRMGEMPGGWTAPEVSMPNPIDMGDQMQDNIKDLPEQIRNMDVGN
ncbi:hypothetical protein MNBD_GAMMA05-63 [hydrothermal vent metagenome]|uniref:Uncharacterized protein n=1 Tax=hydrothermal vent metagenome TaxID=652676 RepID=A0A3B0WH20_9ZZZZ